MNRPQSSLHALLICILLLGFWPAASAGQACFLADFDTDGSPWTIRTECDGPSCAVNFILEVPQNPPLGEWFWIFVSEGCCDFPAYDGHYGARVGPMTPDPTYIQSYSETYTTCTCCSDWFIYAQIRPDAPLVPGQRYVIARGPAMGICNPRPGCDPPHDFSARFEMESGHECQVNEVYMALNCETSGAPTGDLTAGRLALGAPSPNPFSADGALSYAVMMPRSGRALVRLYNVAGGLEATLIDRVLPAGMSPMRWSPMRVDGTRLASGVYFLRCDALGGRTTRMIVVAR